MPLDLLRDSVFGNLVNSLSGGRFLPYDDQRPGYVIPQRYLLPDSPSPKSISLPASRAPSQTPTVVESVISPPETLVNAGGVCKELSKELSTEDKEVDVEKRGCDDSEFIIVSFDENDQDRPLNWSSNKRHFVAFLIGLLTFAVYVASACYTPSIPGIMQELGASQVLATAGLSLFVCFYGIAPMLLAPMQEVAAIGRNPVYIAGLFLFVICQIPPLFTNSVAVVLVFRAAAGFVGSPALSTGGASIADVMAGPYYSLGLAGWSMGAVAGPTMGPVFGGFAAMKKGWRWPFLEMLWIAAAVFIVLFFLLPETYEPTVLLRRAQRLRKLTGNDRIKAPSEIGKHASESVGFVIWENMYRAVRLALEPSILVANSYIALVYAVFYLWFEAFPIVFNEKNHFNLGISGLPYLGFVVSGAVTLTIYIYYQVKVLNPYLEAHPETGPEIRLRIALVAAVCIPISLFGFGWTAQTNQHWMLPIVFASIYLPGIFLAFQSIMMYVALSYPKYAASVLAGNDLFRSVFASAFPLFGAKFFTALGLGGGSSLLAGVSILMIPILWAIMRYGATLRARSSFAETPDAWYGSIRYAAIHRAGSLHSSRPLDISRVINHPDPQDSYVAQLKPDVRYVTTLSYGGHANQFIGIQNLLYLAKVLNRVAVVPTLTALHFEGLPQDVSKFYDIKRFYQSTGIPLIEWSSVKWWNFTAPPPLEPLSCWSVLEQVTGGGRNVNDGSMAVHNIDVKYYALPPLARGTEGDKIWFNAFHQFDSNPWEKQRWLDKVREDLLPRDPTSVDGSEVQLKDGFDPLHTESPSEQLLCFDTTFFVGSRIPPPALPPLVPTDPLRSYEGLGWIGAGQYLRWSEHMDKIADHYLAELFEVSSIKGVPPFITCHIRRGDFADVRGLTSLDKYTDAVQRVRDTLNWRMDNPNGWDGAGKGNERYFRGWRGEDYHVVVATDEAPSSDFVRTLRDDLGWKVINHDIMMTEAKLGSWYPMLIDSVILSRGGGFVGTEWSTFSYLAGLRVKYWNGGVEEWTPSL
ncbi:uncharacterized protein JCM15063_001764 [Sporobolomyces koalae]|uniref:uncharacterized protein n=1 Tax=Sporobolomyces koalae TaxID=500713 RepID=UPI0031716297